MKTRFLFFAIAAALLIAASLAADTIHDQLNGTWSGSWIPEGGVRDAMTIELKHDESGKLTGRFVTPASMNFTTATFNAKTRLLSLEATDPTSGKQYRLNAKVQGTEIKGTVTAGTETGQIDLIKWTYCSTNQRLLITVTEVLNHEKHNHHDVRCSCVNEQFGCAVCPHQ